MRDSSLSILKGFGILLVVLGHSGLENVPYGGGVHDWVYTFHMPLFFIASGYFLSIKILITKSISVGEKSMGFISHSLNGV